MKLTNLLKRATVLLLVASMVFAMVGCGGGGNNDTQSQASGTAAGGSNDAVIDMGGYTFTLSSPFIKNDPDLNSLTDAEQILEQKRHEVEKDYNCHIEVVGGYGSTSNMKALVQSGDRIADIVHVPAAALIPAIRNGLLTDFDSIEGIDPTDARWVSGVTKVGTFESKVYGLNFMRPSEVRHCIIYNRDLLKKCGVTDDITQLVRDKQWTWDKFREICQKCTKDNDGDGQPDVYGFQSAVANAFFGYALIASNNARVVSMDADGYATETLNDKNTIDALQFYYDLLHTYNCMVPTWDATTTAYADTFTQGKYVFLHCESWLLDQNIKKVAGDMDYGMVPLPMGPNATDYASNADNMMMFCITKSNKDLDKTVPVFNALARYVYNYGEEGWWDDDIMLDYFQDGDTDSVEIYNMILESSCLDYGSMVGSINGDFQNKIIGNCIRKQKSSVASVVDSLHGTYDEDIADIFRTH